MSAPPQQHDLLMASSSSLPLDQPKNTISVTSHLNPAVDDAIPVKPMRPLTAYHIFFQLEREMIIQTSEGEIANKSSLDNKVYLVDVPERYKSIRLLPDWYAGPGKRKKRKHRKQHGKIGFLELSQVVSSRWAELDEVDPETKAFVQKIAQSEIDEYYREMKQYKELTKSMPPEIIAKSTPKKIVDKRSSANISNSIDNFALQTIQSQQSFNGMVSPDVVNSSLQIMQLQTRLQMEIDNYLTVIEKRKHELLNSYPHLNQELLKEIPLPFNDFETPVHKKRRVSVLLRDQHIEPPCTVSGSPTPTTETLLADELEIDDAEIISYWNSCPAA